MHRFKGVLVISLLTLSLIACGGGGGGGSAAPVSNTGGNNTDNTPPPETPETNNDDFVIPASPPAVNYSGSTTPLPVSKDFKLTPAALVFIARLYAGITENDWIEPKNIPVGRNAQTVEGEEGGSVRVSFDKSVSETGFIKEVFEDFDTGDLIISGTLIQRFKPLVSIADFYPAISGSMEYHNLTLRQGDDGLIIQGAVVSDPQQANVLIANIIFTLLPSQAQLYLEDFRIELSAISKPVSQKVMGTSLSGKVYAGSIGMVQVSATGPMEKLQEREAFGYIAADSGGGFVFEGVHPRLEFRPISSRYVAFLSDSNGDQIVDEAQRLSWDEMYGGGLASEEDDHAPVANPGDVIQASVGHKVQLHGLFSHDSNRDYLKYQWHLFHKPFGSEVTIPLSSLPVIEFVPDKAGSYLFTLWTTDGAHTREATAKVEARIQAHGADASTERGEIELEMPAQAGDAVMLDGRSALVGLEDSIFWRVNDPASLAYFGAQQGVAQTELNLPQAGIYALSMTHNPPEYFPIKNNELNLSLGGAPFALEGSLGMIGEERQSLIIHQLDYNQNGKDDLIVLGVVPATPSNGALQVLLADDDGNFTLGYEKLVSITSAVVELKSGDLNGDGLPDLAIMDESGSVKVFLQTPGGELGAPSIYQPSFSQPEFCVGETSGTFSIDDFNADGRDDLLILLRCGLVLTVWEQTPGQVLGAATTTSLIDRIPADPDDPYFYAHVALADLNQDQRTDVVAQKHPHYSDPRVHILLNSSGGDFSLHQTLENIASIGNGIRSIGTGDVNGDSRVDILHFGGELSVLLQQNDGSFSLSAGEIKGPVGDELKQLLDLNGDGNLDIISIDAYEGNNIYLGMQRADGGFDFSRYQAENNFVSSVATMDLNQDGELDILLPGSPFTQTTLSVLYGSKYRYSLPVDYKASEPGTPVYKLFTAPLSHKTESAPVLPWRLNPALMDAAVQAREVSTGALR